MPSQLSFRLGAIEFELDEEGKATAGYLDGKESEWITESLDDQDLHILKSFCEQALGVAMMGDRCDCLRSYDKQNKN